MKTITFNYPPTNNDLNNIEDKLLLLDTELTTIGKQYEDGLIDIIQYINLRGLIIKRKSEIYKAI